MNTFLVSKSDAAKRLGIGKKNLEELIRRKKIKIIHLGKRVKIPVFELENYIEHNSMYANEFDYVTDKKNTLKILQLRLALIVELILIN